MDRKESNANSFLKRFVIPKKFKTDSKRQSTDRDPDYKPDVGPLGIKRRSFELPSEVGIKRRSFESPSEVGIKRRSFESPSEVGMKRRSFESPSEAVIPRSFLEFSDFDHPYNLRSRLQEVSSPSNVNDSSTFVQPLEEEETPKPTKQRSLAERVMEQCVADERNKRKKLDKPLGITVGSRLQPADIQIHGNPMSKRFMERLENQRKLMRSVFGLKGDDEPKLKSGPYIRKMKKEDRLARFDQRVSICYERSSENWELQNLIEDIMHKIEMNEDRKNEDRALENSPEL